MFNMEGQLVKKNIKKLFVYFCVSNEGLGILLVKVCH